MPLPSTCHQTFEYARHEPGFPGWRWKFAAYLSSWMILAGYISVLSLNEQASQLRIPSIVAIILSSALLAGGYCLSILICLAFESWQLCQDLIFIPTLNISTLGLFTILYHAALSTTTTFSTSFIIGVLLSGISTLVYAVLAYTAYRRLRTCPCPAQKSIPLSNVSGTPGTSPFPPATPDPRCCNTNPFSDSATQSLRSMPSYQSFSHNGSITTYPTTTISGPQPQQHSRVLNHSQSTSEDDSIRAQMATLLSHRDRSASLASLAAPSQTTYHIQIPDKTPNTRNTNITGPDVSSRISFPRHVLDYYGEAGSTLPAAGLRGRAPQAGQRGRSRSESREDRKRQIEAGVRAVQAAQADKRERSRSKSRGNRRREVEVCCVTGPAQAGQRERSRSKSREDRRKEIEACCVTGPVRA